mgnify:CR=1 FL=1
MPSTTPLPTAPLLDVRHLAKRYGTRQAVADVSLQVAPGTLLGLLLAVLLPPAWVTAAPWLASPDGFVFWAGSLNGVTCDAAAEPLA